jgi:carboxymethylenebutenolidase
MKGNDDMDGLRDQIRSLVAKTDFSRRGFVLTGLTAGFALAVQPVSAQTIVTDSTGLEAGEVKIPVTDGQIPAYRAMPAAGGPFATVLVIQEVFGVHEHIKDICRRLAKLGYFAVAPALYARQGDVSQMTRIEDILSVVSKVPDAQVASDLDATVAWAQSTGNADTARLGVTGFCWGGRQTWLYAEHNPDLKAAVAWYGFLVGTPDPLHPVNPIDQAAQLKCPVLGLYGAQDRSISQDSIENMKAAAKAAGKTAEFIVYADAGHGFNADYRPSYNVADAKDGWNKLQAWFKGHGVG